MKLTLAEPRYLKDSIMIISELVNEARFKINQNGIELVAMDPANVAMVMFQLLASSFVEYNVPQDMELAINLSNLKQVLKRAKPSDMITLEVDEKNKLVVTLSGGSKRKFSLPLIELDEREQKIPELQFPLSVVVPSTVLNDAIEDVDIVGESVAFMVDNGKFTVSAEGDLTDAHVFLPENDEIKITSEAKDKVRAKYSIEYLKKMISAGKLAPNATIKFNRDYPLKLEYKVLDRVAMNFILAPRVESD